MKLEKWHKTSIFYTIWMFVIMTFIWPLIDGEEITLKRIIISAIIWPITGVVVGWSTRKPAS